MAPPEPATGLREKGKQRRTDRILLAALGLLREESDRNLTVERIAARAEVSPMTVFNLVGTREQMWAALADRALLDLDIDAISDDDPHQRARGIVDAVVRVLCSDAAVFRALLSGWGSGGRVLTRDPTSAFIACLRDAGDTDARHHGEILAAGLVGTIHQWTAGLIGDRAFKARARGVVDVVFAAATLLRPPD